MVELDVHKSVVLPEGRYEGVVVGVDERRTTLKDSGEEATYLDVLMEVVHEGKAVRMRYGCRAFVSRRSKLGRLLMDFGVDLDSAVRVDVDKVLVGRRVSFMAVRDADSGYLNVVDGSLKPLPDSAVGVVKSEEVV